MPISDQGHRFKVNFKIFAQLFQKFQLISNGASTNVGRLYKRRAGQTLDWYKRRTSTNVGLVQTSDQYKRRTKEKNV